MRVSYRIGTFAGDDIWLGGSGRAGLIGGAAACHWLDLENFLA